MGGEPFLSLGAGGGWAAFNRPQIRREKPRLDRKSGKWKPNQPGIKFILGSAVPVPQVPVPPPHPLPLPTPRRFISEA